MAEGGLPEARSVDNPAAGILVSAAETVTVFKDAILTILRVPTLITDDLKEGGILNDDDVSTVEQRELLQKDQQGAVSHLLEKLRDAILSEERHFDTFLQALEEADYTLLANILKHGRGCCSTSNFVAFMGHHLQSFLTVILSNTDQDQALAAVEGLVTAMQEKELLEEGDAASAKEDLEESIPAVVLTHLVFCMCRRDDTAWPRPFLTLLLGQGHENFVKQLAAAIDPELIKILEPESAIDEADEVPIDQQLNYVLEQFKDVLKITLFPEKIVKHLSDMYDTLETFGDRKRQILRHVKNLKRGKAVEELLRDVISSEARGKWRLLKTALEKTKHTKEITLLEGGACSLRSGKQDDTSCDFEESAEQENLLKLFMKELEDKLEPLPLLNHLLDSGVLDQNDCEDLKVCHRTERRENVVLLLILRANRNKRRGWFKELLRAMALEDYWDLVELIDEKIFNELKEDLQSPTTNGEEEEGSITVSAEEGCEASLKAGMTEDLYGELPSANVSPGNPTDPSHDSSQRTDLPPPCTSKEASGNGNHLEANPQKHTPDKNLSPNISADENVHATSVPTLPAPGAEALPSLQDQNILGGAATESTEEITLRGYQEELARPALRGKNIIICAPTGSGKTNVAIAISKSHLEGGERRKVAFVVDKVALMEQQQRLFRRYIPRKYKFCGIHGQSQASRTVPLGEQLRNHDVFFMTAQILLDGFTDGSVRNVKEFTLIIMDECHHTDKGHPYNQIMGRYLDEKARSAMGLPQVVGLTASLGTGKAKGLDDALDHVIKLCANMDAHQLCKVVDSVNELEQYVSKPIESIQKVQGRQNDVFTITVSRVMEEIEVMMIDAPELESIGKGEAEKIRKCLRAPAERGNPQYTQWHSSLYKQVVQLYDPACRRKFVSCLSHLKTYNDALIINEDCRTKDALEYVKKEFKELDDTNFDATEEALMDKWQNVVGPLKTYSQDRTNQNPKLEALRRLILQWYTDKPDSLTILFCRTRGLTVALKAWMKETDGLRELNPERLVGANAPGDRAGMTQSMQGDVLKYFRDGRHKIIIATTVAEEGIDIAKCNLVIKYDHVTNEIALVQARGRGRAENSRFVVLAQEGKGVAEKEVTNKIRENLMKQAILKAMELPEHEFLQCVQEQQRQTMIDHRMEEQGAASPSALAPPVDFHLRCVNCDKYACSAAEIRKVEGAHHVILEAEFWNKCEVTWLPQPKMLGGKSFGLTGKLRCKSCNNKWGSTCIYKKNKFPVMSIERFIVVDTRGKRDAFKKWNKVPFCVRELTPDDLESWLKQLREATSDDSIELPSG